MFALEVRDTEPIAFLRIHHSGYDQSFGHYVEIERDNQILRAIAVRQPWRHGRLVLGKPSLQVLAELDWWNCIARRKLMLLKTKLDSNTGHHSAFCFSVNENDFYRVKLFNSSLWFKDFSELHTYTDGYPYVGWKYEKRVHAVLVLDFVDFGKPQLVANLADIEPVSQGHLVTYYLGYGDDGLQPLLRWKKDYRIYNHVIQGNSEVFACFDKANLQKLVFVKLHFNADVVAEDHGTLSLGPGLYLFVHPLPSKDVD